MKQLETPADIHQLVTLFYDKVLKDELLAPFFSRLDFTAHLPKMEQFWRFAQLLAGQSILKWTQVTK